MEELGEKEVKDIKFVFSRRAENFVDKHLEAPKHPVVDPESLLDKIFNFFSNSEKECDYSINVYRDMQALLAARVSSGLFAQTHVYEGRVTCSALVERGNFNESYRIKGVTAGEKECYGWGFSSEIRESEPYGRLFFNTLESLPINNIKNSMQDNLTYNGICAILALAPREFILETKNVLADEIQRNYKLESSKIDIEENDSDHRINEVGEKYLELEGCLCVLKERFEEEIAIEQESAQKYEDLKHQNIVKAATTDIAISNELKDMNRFLNQDNVNLDSLPNVDDIKLDSESVEACGESQGE